METSPTFGIKEGIDLLNAQTSRLDTLWMFYWVVTGAVVGLAYSQKIVGDNWKIKLGLTIGFCVFAYINFAALFTTQRTLAELTKGIKKMAADPQVVAPPLVPALATLRRARPWEMAPFHLFLDAGVILALWLPNFLSLFQASGSPGTPATP